MEWDETILCIVPRITLVSETVLALMHMAAGLWSQETPYISKKPQLHKVFHEMWCSFAMCESS